jgi:hypothetical protein
VARRLRTSALPGPPSSEACYVPGFGGIRKRPPGGGRPFPAEPRENRRARRFTAALGTARKAHGRALVPSAAPSRVPAPSDARRRIAVPVPGGAPDYGGGLIRAARRLRTSALPDPPSRSFILCRASAGSASALPIPAGNGGHVVRECPQATTSRVGWISREPFGPQLGRTSAFDVLRRRKSSDYGKVEPAPRPRACWRDDLRVVREGLRRRERGRLAKIDRDRPEFGEVVVSKRVAARRQAPALRAVPVGPGLEAGRRSPGGT